MTKQSREHLSPLNIRTLDNPITPFLTAREKVLSIKEKLPERYRVPFNIVARTIFTPYSEFVDLHTQALLLQGMYSDEAKLFAENMAGSRAGSYFEGQKKLALKEITGEYKKLILKKSGYSSLEHSYLATLAHEMGHYFAQDFIPISADTAANLVGISQSDFDANVETALSVNPKIALAFLTQELKISEEEVFTLIGQATPVDLPPAVICRQWLMEKPASLFEMLSVSYDAYLVFIAHLLPQASYKALSLSIWASISLGSTDIVFGNFDLELYSAASELFSEAYGLWMWYLDFIHTHPSSFTSLGASLSAFKKSANFKEYLTPNNLVAFPILEAVDVFKGFDKLCDCLQQGLQTFQTAHNLSHKEKSALLKILETQLSAEALGVAFERYYIDSNLTQKVDLAIASERNPQGLMRVVANCNGNQIYAFIQKTVVTFSVDEPLAYTNSISRIFSKELSNEESALTFNGLPVYQTNQKQLINNNRDSGKTIKDEYEQIIDNFRHKSWAKKLEIVINKSAAAHQLRT